MKQSSPQINCYQNIVKYCSDESKSLGSFVVFFFVQTCNKRDFLFKIALKCKFWQLFNCSHCLYNNFIRI